MQSPPPELNPPSSLNVTLMVNLSTIVTTFQVYIKNTG